MVSALVRIVSFAALAYFGSLIGFMLYVNKILISRRHWSARQCRR